MMKEIKEGRHLLRGETWKMIPFSLTLLCLLFFFDPKNSVSCLLVMQKKGLIVSWTRLSRKRETPLSSVIPARRILISLPFKLPENSNDP
jgi:hypothetical protein